LAAQNDPSEFFFRYSLSESEVTPRERMHDDPVTELFRQQILNLLDVVQPTHGGLPVAIDGFSFLRDPKTIFRLHRLLTEKEASALSESSSNDDLKGRSS